MPKIKLKLVLQSAAAVLFGSLVLAAVPALAENGSSDTSSSTSESQKEPAKKADQKKQEDAKKAAEAKAEAAKKEAETKQEAAKQEAETKREAIKQDVEKKREAAKQEIEKKREETKNDLEQKKEKLKDDKLKTCREREGHINDNMSSLATRGQERLDLFATITERTETFYKNKGKTLANYDALVAAVGAKKAAAQAAVDAVISSSVSFKCDGTDPKGVAAEFKSKVKAMNTALKEYRSAVKNLIVGVKSVQSTESEGSH